jgi:hypothetical protein
VPQQGGVFWDLVTKNNNFATMRKKKISIKNSDIANRFKIIKIMIFEHLSFRGNMRWIGEMGMKGKKV